MAKEFKKINFAAPTTWVDSMNFKFVSSQDAARFVETKDNMENYAAVSYKHNSADARKSMEEIKESYYIYLK